MESLITDNFFALSICGVILIGLLLLTPRFARKKSNNNRRQADRTPLSRKEKAVFDKARQLFQQKQILPAAKLLESINRQREAVQMLEEGGQIDEAANMLLRMQRPNRAGVVYARHAQWKKAAECFTMANMPLEVARCAREQGDFRAAAENFLKSEHFQEAAECFSDVGDFRNAARNYARSGYDRKATDLYLKVFDASPLNGSESFADDELSFFIEQLSRGNGPVVFARILDTTAQLPQAIFNLLRYGNFSDAARLMAQAKEEYFDRLNALASGHEYAAQNLIKAYEINNAMAGCAKLHEALGDYAKAVVCYIKAGMGSDADRCKNIAIEIQRAKSDEPASFADTLGTAETEIIAQLQAPAEPTMATKLHLSDQKRAEYSEFVRKIGLFSDLNLDERLSIMAAAQERTYKTGETIAAEHNDCDGLYFVKSGQVRIQGNLESSVETRQELETGEVFGEGWTFFDELLPASYVAKTETTLLCIEKATVLELLDKNMTVSRRLYKTLLRQWRLHSTTTRNHWQKQKAS